MVSTLGDSRGRSAPHRGHRHRRGLQISKCAFPALFFMGPPRPGFKVMTISQAACKGGWPTSQCIPGGEVWLGHCAKQFSSSSLPSFHSPNWTAPTSLSDCLPLPLSCHLPVSSLFEGCLLYDFSTHRQNSTSWVQSATSGPVVFMSHVDFVLLPLH